jgi:LPS O-antigen subunit length determinant protein (WzzB/FepE family)
LPLKKYIMEQNTQIQHQQQQPIQEDEIDLIALAKTFWNGRRTIIKSIIICGIIGLTVALVSPKEYTASTTMVPQMSDPKSSLGGLGGLAAMAGFNLNMGGGTELSPTIYPQIVSSITFQKELMQTQVKFADIDQPVSLFDYYTEYAKASAIGSIKKYTIGLPFVILKAIRPKKEDNPGSTNSNLITLSEDEKEVLETLAEQLSLEFNDKDGYVTITARMPEALPAAQVADKAQKLLQEYITEFKIEKAKANLEFIQERYNETKTEFETVQENRARFYDRNKNVTTAMALTERDRFDSNYNLIYGVYSDLAKQLEQAEISVKENTPVFSIIQPVSVPIEKSKPKRPMILIIWLFIGGIIGTGVVFGKEYLTQFKQRWQEQ